MNDRAIMITRPFAPSRYRGRFDAIIVSSSKLCKKAPRIDARDRILSDGYTDSIRMKFDTNF